MTIDEIKKAIVTKIFLEEDRVIVRSAIRLTSETSITHIEGLQTSGAAVVRARQANADALLATLYADRRREMDDAFEAIFESAYGQPAALWQAVYSLREQLKYSVPA